MSADFLEQTPQQPNLAIPNLWDDKQPLNYLSGKFKRGEGDHKILEVASLLINSHPNTVHKSQIVNEVWQGFHCSGLIGNPIKRLRSMLPYDVSLYTVGHSGNYGLFSRQPVNTKFVLPEELPFIESLEPSLQPLARFIHTQSVIDSCTLKSVGELQTVNLLDIFLSRPGEVISTKEIENEFPDVDPLNKIITIRTHISYARDLLGWFKPVQYVLTNVRKMGYIFEQQ